MQRTKRSGEPVDAVPVLIRTTIRGSAKVYLTASNGNVFLLLEDQTLMRVDADGGVQTGPVVSYDFPGDTPLSEFHMAAADDSVFVANEGQVVAYTANLRRRWPDALTGRSSGASGIVANGSSAIVFGVDARGIAGARITRDGVVQPFTVMPTTDRVSWIAAA